VRIAGNGIKQQPANQLNQANAKNMSSGMAAGEMMQSARCDVLDARVKRASTALAGDDDALGKMGGYNFEYNDMKIRRAGRAHGRDGQDLAGSKAGSRMVVQDRRRKRSRSRFRKRSFLLGATARLHER